MTRKEHLPLFSGTSKGVSEIHGLVLPVDRKRHSLVWANPGTREDAVAPDQVAPTLIPARPCLWPLPDTLIQGCLTVALQTRCNGGKAIGLVRIRTIVSYVPETVLKGSCCTIA